MKPQSEIDPQRTSDISIPETSIAASAGISRPDSWMMDRPTLSGLVILILTVAGFSLGNRLFESILPSNNGWSIYWPHNAIGLGLLLITERRRWPWIIGGFTVASLVNEIVAHDSLAEMAMATPCNLAQVLFSAHLLPRFRSLRQWMMEPHLAIRFAAFAIVIARLSPVFLPPGISPQVREASPQSC